MISSKCLFSGPEITSSAKKKFPADPESVKEFFDEKGLLLMFQGVQMNKLCRVLADRSVTSFEFTSILHGFTEEERRSEPRVLSKEEIQFRNLQIKTAVTAVFVSEKF